MEKNKRNKIIQLSSLTIIFFLIGFLVMNDSQGVLFDRAIMESLHSGSNDALITITRFVSFLGSGKVIVAAVGLLTIYLVWKKEYYITKMILANSAGSYILNFILKMVYTRTRPIEFFRIEYDGYSFPSGHSMTTMSLFLTIAYLTTRKGSNKDRKPWIYSLAIIYILFMGFSRLYLGVHWPTDVLAGFIMGYIIHSLSKIIIKE